MIRAALAALMLSASPAIADDRQELMAYVNASIAGQYCGIEPDLMILNGIKALAARNGVNSVETARNIARVAGEMAQTYTREQIRDLCATVLRAYRMYGAGR